MTGCISHTYDYSWWKDANVVLNKSNPAPQKIMNKVVKKKFYKEKMEEYKN